VSGGVRQNAADTKSVPVNEDESPSTVADIRALAEQAEAEAAEAEALAAAARARARAIQLRREAQRLEAADKVKAKEEVEAKQEFNDDVEANVTEAVQSEVEEPRSEVGESGHARPAAEPESVETEDSPEDAAEEGDASISSADDAGEQAAAKQRWYQRWRRRPRWSTVAAGLAILVIVASLAGSVYMFVQHREATQRQRRVAEFAATARQGVVTLTSLDFNNAKQGVQHILDDSTGSFKDDFLKMADDFTKVVEQSKVVSQGTVSAAAVDLDTMTDNSAVVLVASTSEVTNAAGAKQDPRSYRLIVTVARDGDQLKISKVEFVP
jgi:Mce-associated membrane protein